MASGRTPGLGARAAPAWGRCSRRDAQCRRCWRSTAARLHDEPTSADGSTAPQRPDLGEQRGCKKSQRRPEHQDTQQRSGTAPSTAASMPTFASSSGTGRRHPARQHGSRQPDQHRPRQPDGGHSGAPQQQPPAAAPTTIPSDTLPAIAGTSHSAGTTCREYGNADDHCSPAARIGDAGRLPEVLGKQGTRSQAKQCEPDNRRRERHNRPGQCLRASEPGPRTNTRATGTAVATSSAAPSHAITTVAGPVSASTWLTSSRPCSAAAASLGKLSCSNGAASTAYGSR